MPPTPVCCSGVLGLGGGKARVGGAAGKAETCLSTWAAQQVTYRNEGDRGNDRGQKGST